ncbi:hypothetical protein HY251_01335 [bacterium]|nr:hypothetical protein [bacterium]
MLTRLIVSIAVVAVLLSGCSSKSDRKDDGPRSQEPDWREEDRRANGEAPPVKTGTGDPVQLPSDGPIATVIYVTEAGAQGSKRPLAMIFSSDMKSRYLEEEPGPTRIVKKFPQARMGLLFADLKRAGLETLLGNKQTLAQSIDAGRQIILIQGESRTSYREPPGVTDARPPETLKTFRKCEQALISYSYIDDPFIEIAPANKK